MRILLIEDEHMLGEAVRDHLATLGHAVDWMQRLDDAGEALATTPYDLVLLDLNLPDGRGLDLLRALRRRGDATPVMILTAMDQLSMRLEGLNAGADDYVIKPFDLDELAARVAAVNRRYSGNPNPLIVIDELEIDQARRSASVSGRQVDLTAREWAILERLAQRPGVYVAKSELEDALFAFGAEIDSNAIEVYMSRLRRKLNVDLIHTARGLGYRLGRS